jgi:hypothetical protein
VTIHLSTSIGIIKALKGNKNALLLIVFSFYYRWVEQLLMSTSVVTRQYIHKEVALPYTLALVAFGMLCLEGWASRYIIDIEHFRYKQHPQTTATWPTLTQNNYMAYVGLCSLLFRPFFRMTLIIIPVLTPLINTLKESPLGTVSWLLKAPIWIAGGWMLWREAKLLFSLSRPSLQHPQFLKEALARWILMTLLALFMVTFKVGFRQFFWLPNPYTFKELLGISFPFVLFFTMFFLPLRLLEFWVDWVDCRTFSRKALYVASVVWLMFTTVTH